MSILAGAKRPQHEPLVVTICGTPGTGKTSLAATFPQPAFVIQTQGEKLPRDIPEDQMPVSLGETVSTPKLWEQLRALTMEKHEFKTVIIDSVTGLEILFSEDVLKSDPKTKSIQTALGGYGAGRDAVAIMHGRVRKAAEVMRRKGINVVFIAHSDVVRIDPPDSEGFTQYSLRLHSKSMAPYVDSVDVVGFIKQNVAVMGEEGKRRAVSTGDRSLVTYLTPTAVTKNRLGITDDIELKRGVNPIAKWTGQPRTEIEPEPIDEELAEVESETEEMEQA